MKAEGWGRFPRIDGQLVSGWDEMAVLRRIAAGGSMIACGARRSYGDASLNPAGMLSMVPMDRLLDFDPATGLLLCEAGVTLADILDVFVPRGWFPAVTPGTRFVTVGGAVAADVHGKNHHRDGGFGAHLAFCDVMLADGRVIRCSPDRDPDLFAATLGGMGLTGVILRASLRLRPIETAWIREDIFRSSGLDETLDLFGRLHDRSYSVAWIDAFATGARIGRAVVMTGDHAGLDELPAELRQAPLARTVRRLPAVPPGCPSWLLNRASVRAFNEAYHRLARPRRRLSALDSFFHPLDAVPAWNRLYGRRGFLQYQCVLPRTAAAAGLRRLLAETAGSGWPSFLAMLKPLGEQGMGLMSFPMEGYTLALDFPAAEPVFPLLRRLDAIVDDHGGRLYLAKDARMDAGMLRRGYPAVDRFQEIRAAYGSCGRFGSLQSRRLDL
ncbi:FAD-binding oxidoreductase [Azospirillum sp. B506]|uniref:FAD-binding oxidoreductase n=1 Tax=Azospirillum sp. B506 TaxID=137721 RepID=UPI0005B2EB12|nr:FAD-binding oxidoreductase [Azospirillum sp. B506]